MKPAAQSRAEPLDVIRHKGRYYIAAGDIVKALRNMADALPDDKGGKSLRTVADGFAAVSGTEEPFKKDAAPPLVQCGECGAATYVVARSDGATIVLSAGPTPYGAFFLSQGTSGAWFGIRYISGKHSRVKTSRYRLHACSASAS